MVQHADIDHTGIAGITGIPATLFDAKGDIIGASAADTAARLAVGTDGQVLTADSGETTGLKWTTVSGSGTNLNPGTSFPGSPSSNDLCYRTDRDLLYFYDGTRWLTVNLYRGAEGVLVASTTTSGQVVARFSPWHTTYDLWIVSLFASLFVATTNDGTKYWTLAFVKYQSDLATASTPGSVNTSANAANTVVTSETAIGALFNPTTYKFAQWEATKTSTPGALTVACGMSYRLVG